MGMAQHLGSRPMEAQTLPKDLQLVGFEGAVLHCGKPILSWSVGDSDDDSRTTQSRSATPRTSASQHTGLV